MRTLLGARVAVRTPIVATLLALGVSGCARNPEPLSARARAVAALGSLRPSLLRLAGQVRHAPCVARVADAVGLARVACRETGAVPPAVDGLLRSLRSAPRDSAAPDAAWALALVDLAIAPGPSSRRRMLDLLEPVVAVDTGAVAALNDLAVALMAGDPTPDDAFRALELLERAAELDRSEPAVAFNRAALLDLLGLLDQASEAWSRYLALDPDGGWADEARERRAAIARLSAPGRTASALATLGRDGFADVDSVARLVRGDPEAVREFLRDSLLGAWSNAWVEGGEPDADVLGAARRLAEQLYRATGDSSSLVSVIGLQAVPAGERARIARGVLGLVDARRLFARGDFARAGQVADAALAEWASGDVAPPEALATRARLIRAAAAIYSGSLTDAVARYRAIETTIAGRSFPSLEGEIDWGLGISLFRLGRIAEATEVYRRAARLFRGIGDDASAGAIEGQLLDCYHRSGRDEEALAAALRGLGLLRRHRSHRYLHNTLLAVSWTLEQRGLLAAAHVVNREVVRVAARTGRDKDPLEAAASLSHTAAALGRTGEGTRALTDARALADRVTDPGMRERLEIELDRSAAALALRDDPAGAAELLDSVVSYYRRDGFVGNLGPSLAELAEALLLAGERASAEEVLLDATRVVSDSGNRLDPATEAALVETRASIFRNLAEVRLLRGDTAAAWTAIENFRLLGIDPRREPPTAPEALARRLDAAQAVVGYWVRDSTPLAWVATARGVTTVPLPADGPELRGLVAAFERELVGRRDAGELRRLGRALDQRIVEPIRDLIDGRARLAIVPDGPLATLPFAALVSVRTDRYLIEDLSLRFLPATSLVDQRREGAGDPLGAPLFVDGSAFERAAYPELGPLPGAAAEVAGLAGLVPRARTLAGPAAEPARVAALLPTASLFHFSGHARSLMGDPALSSLVLPGGALLGEEIARLRLDRLELVLLSACGTVRRASRGGLPTSGLSRAFLSAGASRVVSSLWEADDHDLEVFFAPFYRALEDGATIEAALRSAQLSALDGASVSPAMWAAFRLEAIR